MNRVLLPHWGNRGSGLEILLTAADLTITDQEGSETLHDRILTDGQDNSILTDWDYTPPGGKTKPVLDVGVKLSGTSIGGYGSLLSVPATGTGVLGSFYYYVKLALGHDPGGGILPLAAYLANVFDGYAVTVIIPSSPGGSLMVTANVTVGADSATTTPGYAVPLNTAVKLGLYAESIDASSHKVHLVVDDIVVATATAAIPIQQPVIFPVLALTTAGPGDDAALDWYEYRFSTSVFPVTVTNQVILARSDIFLSNSAITLATLTYP